MVLAWFRGVFFSVHFEPCKKGVGVTLLVWFWQPYLFRCTLILHAGVYDNIIIFIIIALDRLSVLPLLSVGSQLLGVRVLLSVSLQPLFQD